MTEQSIYIGPIQHDAALAARGECWCSDCDKPSALDVERLARAMYDADPNYAGLGMGPKIEWSELSDGMRGQLVTDAADVAIRYERRPEQDR